MSLNSREIDIILEELDLPGMSIERLAQGSIRNIFLQVYRPGRTATIRICAEHPRVRLHEVPPSGGRGNPRLRRSHQRFESFLHSRITGGRIIAADHLNRDRIIRFTIQRSGEVTLLFLRLWGPRVNMIATTEDLTILDAWFRKPQEGIETGVPFAVPPAPSPPRGDRPARPVLPGMSFNETIAALYREMEEAAERLTLSTTCVRILEKRAGRLTARLQEISGGTGRAARVEQLRHQGELILANLYRISPGADHVVVQDYANEGRELRIPLDPRLPAAQNAQRFFDHARRSEESRDFLEATERNLRQELKRTGELLEAIGECSLQELRDYASSLGEQEQRAPDRRHSVGLTFQSQGFQILVGRNARENDALLRHAVRGNDWWLHTRDVPGGYVFIRTPRGKSIPLDVLLDAGNLAVFFSKARGQQEVNLYYTAVKHLRRARGAARGTVLPTQEKNLAIRPDEERLKKLGITGSAV